MGHDGTNRCEQIVLWKAMTGRSLGVSSFFSGHGMHLVRCPLRHQGRRATRIDGYNGYGFRLNSILERQNMGVNGLLIVYSFKKQEFIVRKFDRDPSGTEATPSEVKKVFDKVSQSVLRTGVGFHWKGLRINTELVLQSCWKSEICGEIDGYNGYTVEKTHEEQASLLQDVHVWGCMFCPLAPCWFPPCIHVPTMFEGASRQCHEGPILPTCLWCQPQVQGEPQA